NELLTPDIDRLPQEHPDGGQSESVVPVIGFPDPPTEDGGQKATDVDSHIEDVEPKVPSFVLILVQPPNHGGNIGLETAHPQDHKKTAQIKGHFRVQGQHRMSD